MKLQTHLHVVQVGDGEDGGGVVLAGVDWSSKVMSLAEEVLQEDGRRASFALYAFRVVPASKQVRIRLDKLTDK